MSNVVVLGKGNTVNLSKSEGVSLSKLAIGVGWDPVKKKKGFFSFGSSEESIDLDASLILLDEDKQLVDMIWFRKKLSSCGSVRHSGDNLTGEGEGDDETIFIDMANLPARVKYIVPTVNSFRQQTFDQVENAFCNIYDLKGDRPDQKQKLVNLSISEKGAFTGLILAVIERNGDGWKTKYIGKPTMGQVAGEMMRDIVGEL